MADRVRIALVAHDLKKDELVAFVGTHRDVFANVDIYATGTTGSRVLAAYPELRVERLKSGPLGGDLQVGGLIAEGLVDALLFFVDPLTAMPHDVDVKALMRVALVYDLPMALNPRTAHLLLAAPERLARDAA